MNRFLSTLMLRLKTSRCRSTPKQRRLTFQRPLLECLEDRIVPSPYMNYDPQTNTLSIYGGLNGRQSDDTISLYRDVFSGDYEVTVQIGNPAGTYTGQFKPFPGMQINILSHDSSNNIYIFGVAANNRVQISNDFYEGHDYVDVHSLSSIQGLSTSAIPPAGPA